MNAILNFDISPQKWWRNSPVQRIMMGIFVIPFLCGGLFIPSIAWSAFDLKTFGVDQTTSLGQFRIRVTKEKGQELFGAGVNFCPGDPNNPAHDICAITSPALADYATKIGRSDPHSDGDSIDAGGAKVSCSGDPLCPATGYFTVKDDDFDFVPNGPFYEGPAGTKEIHTHILSFEMTPDTRNKESHCVGSSNLPAIRAGSKILAPHRDSIGEVEIRPSPDDSFGESFFNVFVEVEFPSGGGSITLYNKKPLVIQSDELDNLPPRVVYKHESSSTVPLVYDKSTDEPFGWLTLAGHGIQYDCQNLADYNDFMDIMSKMKENTNLEPLPLSCAPATYSNDTRQAILPCVDIPLYTDVVGTPIELTGVYSVMMEIPFGFSDFEVKELTFLEIIDTPNPLHAHFSPDTGILDVPRIDVPVIIPLFGGDSADGPILQCNATLQQSALRAEVLMLKEFDCKLP